MTREVPEWRGKADDAAIPPRVKARIVNRQSGCCAECGRAFSERLRPEFDHKLALVNLGEHTETNLRALCIGCHAVKTAADVGLKAMAAKVQRDRLGLAPKPRHPMAGSKASPWKRTVDGRTIRRDA